MSPDTVVIFSMLVSLVSIFAIVIVANRAFRNSIRCAAHRRIRRDLDRYFEFNRDY